MKNLLKYLVSFETKYSQRLPLNSETHEPASEYEHPFGTFSDTLNRWWAKATSAGGHATPLYYWMVALVLGAITIIEVWIFTLPLVRWFFISSLIILSLTKFVLVIAFYMHLRFDRNVYSWVFGACMFIGVAVFVLTLLLTQFFGFFQ